MKYNFASVKNPTYAKKHVVASSESLASQAGLEILKKGGNAIDAAVATAAALTVVEPCSNGIGSDNFAIVYFKDKLYGMNSSGYSSENINIKKIKALGYEKMPTFGVIPITVPGTPKGWANLIDRFGKLSLEEVLAPAVKLAREGFAISENVGYYFENSIKKYHESLKGSMFDSFFQMFTNNGKRYKAGDIFKSELMAETLEEIGKSNSKSFYEGSLAKKIVSFMEKHNGFINDDDLKCFDSSFVEPIKVNYKGIDVYEIPPNGQGITALMALNLLKDKELACLEAETLHFQIEALKIAFSDTLKYVTDKEFMKINSDFLLSEEYVNKRKNDLKDKAQIQQPIEFHKSGTVYLATADDEGNMVSFIQSNYMGFGSGIVIDGTGISMQNRGHTFSLDENHHNALMPRKKTYHTIIPGFMMKNNYPIGPFGVMGGFMQPQGHLQVIMNLVDFGMNPQESLDAPRFRWDEGLRVSVEDTMPEFIISKLEERGHIVNIEERGSSFGRGQIILNKGDHYLCGNETRCDGTIAYE
jgi:gamma-glutamyltranspeptidase/glutathione hydrolase